MRLPREITPAARARRGLLSDCLLAAAIVLAALVLSAGVGIVGAAGLVAALVLALWFVVEKLGIAFRRRWRRHRSRAGHAKQTIH